MAQKVFVEMVDDIDGGAANQTVPFSLDGVQYEIDLSESNAGTLRDELARFIAASRRVGGRKVRMAASQSMSGSSTASSVDRERSRAIRAWALENGYKVSERGRISAEVMDAFEQAEREPAAPAPAESVAKAPRKRAPRKKAASA